MFVLVIIIMLSINGIFAAYEMALASISRVRLEVLRQEKRRGTRSAIWMKEHLAGSLATIQVVCTFAGAIAAASGGVAVDEVLSPLLQTKFKLTAGMASACALILFVLPLSAITIVFSELLPKMTGINHNEWVVLKLSPMMKGITRFFRPLVFLFEWALKGLLQLGGAEVSGEGGKSKQAGLLELRAAATLARAKQVIGPLEERIVTAAAQLSGRTVSEVMVPVPDIKMINESATIAEALIEAHLHMHTRYPVASDLRDPNTIVGYVTFKDIVCCLKMDPWGRGVKGIIRPIHRFASTKNLAQALTDMIRDRLHIVLIMQHNAVCGLLTLEEVVEELVGDIDDEYDRLSAQVYQVGGGWLAGGGVTLGELARIIGLTELPPTIEPDLLLADWANDQGTRQARSGDIFRLANFEVLVRKMRRSRATESIIRQITATAPVATDAMHEV